MWVDFAFAEIYAFMTSIASWHQMVLIEFRTKQELK